MKKNQLILISTIVSSLLIGFCLGRVIKTPIGFYDRHAVVSEELSDQQIRDYLEQSIAIKSYNGKVFCEFEKFSTERVSLLTYTYVWAHCEEYKTASEMGSGISLPVQLVSNINTIKNQNEIIAYNEPRDGSYYTVDVNKIFPDPQKVFKFDSSKLQQLIKNRVSKYFNN